MLTSLLIPYFSFPWTFPSHRFYVLINYQKFKNLKKALGYDAVAYVQYFITFATLTKLNCFCLWLWFIIMKSRAKWSWQWSEHKSTRVSSSPQKCQTPHCLRTVQPRLSVPDGWHVQKTLGWLRTLYLNGCHRCYDELSSLSAPFWCSVFSAGGLLRNTARLFLLAHASTDRHRHCYSSGGPLCAGQHGRLPPRGTLCTFRRTHAGFTGAYPGSSSLPYTVFTSLSLSTSLSLCYWIPALTYTRIPKFFLYISHTCILRLLTSFSILSQSVW